MVLYALPIYDENGAKKQLVLQDGTLGYPHAILQDESGNDVEFPNVPPEAPPTGKFPAYDENGNQVLITFDILQATGYGPAVYLKAYVGTKVTERFRMVQLDDESRVEFDLWDADGPIDLTNALTLELECQRADRSLLTKQATAEAGQIDPNVLSLLVAQFDDGDVQSFGDWLMQAHVVLANGREFRSQVRRVPVEPNV